MTSIEENINLVHEVLHKMNFNKSNSDYDDLFQIGCLGLISAATTYKESKNKFSTYAFRCIKNQILMSFRKNKIKSKEVYIDNIPKNTDGITFLDMFKDSTDKEPDNILEIKRVNKNLSQAIAMLKEENRRIVKLYVGNNLKQKDLAKMINIEKSNMSKKITKIFKNIKNNYMLLDNSESINRILKKYDTVSKQLYVATVFEGISQQELALKLNVSKSYVSKKIRPIMNEVQRVIFNG